MESSGRLLGAAWFSYGFLWLMMLTSKSWMPSGDDLGTGLLVIGTFALGLWLCVGLMLTGVAFGIQEIWRSRQDASALAYLVVLGSAAALLAQALYIYFFFTG